MTATPTRLPILPTAPVGSYAEPDRLIDRANLTGAAAILRAELQGGDAVR